MSYAKLAITWNEQESGSYYVNQITAGWDKQKLHYWLKSSSGTYRFYPKDKTVTLDTGTELRNVRCLKWEVTA